jgi:hypothetical protein
VEIVPDFTYEALAAHAYVLVPTKITVTCSNIRARGVKLPPLAFPFGFLDRISIRAPAHPECSFTIELLKTTGSEKSEKLTPDNNTFNIAKDNKDGADADIRVAKTKTGHVLTARMIAAGSVVGITVDFDGGDVHDFFIDYYGANALSIADASTRGPKYPFQFPPLTESARMRRVG